MLPTLQKSDWKEGINTNFCALPGPLTLAPMIPRTGRKFRVSTSHVLQKWDIYRKLGDQTLADKCWMELSNEKTKTSRGGTWWNKIRKELGLTQNVFLV